MGFALWLVPSGDEFAALERLKAFRPRHYRKSRSSRSYPYFAPHITLATYTTPGFTSLDAVLPDRLNAVPVFFESIKAGNTYMGAVGVNIAKTSELLAMGKDIVNHMRLNGIEPKQRGFPHMSLFYVDEPEERQLLDRELRATGRIMTIRQDGKNMALLKHDPSNRHFAPMSGFTGSEIWLVDCNSKDVEAWHVMEKMRLRPSRRSSAPPTVAPAAPPPVNVVYSNRPAAVRPEPQYVIPASGRHQQGHRPPVSQSHYYRDEGRRLVRKDGGRSSSRTRGSEDRGGRSSSDTRRYDDDGRQHHRRRSASADHYERDRCGTWVDWVVEMFTIRRA